MLTTPKDPPGSAGSAEGASSSPAPHDPGAALEAARIQHELALLAAHREREQTRTAAAPTTPRAEEPGSTPSEGPGTVASWVAHHQLGVAVGTIGEQVARALGVVPRAERVAMSEAVTDALVKSARDHLDRAAAAEISGVPRSALEQACMAALDRQAQLSIDEARRRNSLEESEPDPRHDAVSDVDPADATPHTPEATRAIRVLVTDDPLVAAGAWRAQHLSAQVAAHRDALRRLTAQMKSARQDLETTLDCWVRGSRPGSPGSPDTEHADDAHPTREEQWRAQAGIAEAAAAAASGAKILADATDPLALSLQLLQLAHSDLTASHTTVTTGAHELVIRGAAALATNLGSQGCVIADQLTALDPTNSPLMSALDDLLRQRADLASGVAGLAGIVSFARSLAGLDEPLSDGARQPDAVASGPSLQPGLRELARQALLHERLVTHVVDCLETLDRDVRIWVQPGDGSAEPPLLAAVRRERLRAGAQRFTHVLVLQDEGLTADVVRRHSIVGDSARLTHIGSASVTWLLIDVASGAVVEGGQASPARTLVQDIGSGRTNSVSMSVQHGAPLPWDAQHTLELSLKFLAVTAGLAALILAVVALVNIFLE